MDPWAAGLHGLMAHHPGTPMPGVPGTARESCEGRRGGQVCGWEQQQRQEGVAVREPHRRPAYHCFCNCQQRSPLRLWPQRAPSLAPLPIRHLPPNHAFIIPSPCFPFLHPLCTSCCPGPNPPLAKCPGFYFTPDPHLPFAPPSELHTLSPVKTRLH